MILRQRKLRKIEDEVWMVIPDSDFLYQVSNYGRVKSFVFNKNEGQILKCSEIRGFKVIQLKLNKVRHKQYVHKLTAEVWIPKPSDKHIYVAHVDGNLKNNNISNLKWHTKDTLMKHHREIFKRKINSSRRPKVINHKKLQESDVKQIKSMIQKGITQSIIAKMFCVSEMQVSRIKRGENWSHIKL